jgi:Domain of unknown function (DUF4266)
MKVRMSARMRSWTGRAAIGFALAAVLVSGSGCAATTVRAYEREHLADRIMSFKADAKRDARMIKSFEAREGSTGGSGGAGGGCACN